MYEEIKKELYEYSSLPSLSDEELIRLINSIYIKRMKSEDVNTSGREECIAKIFSSIRGLGILDELLLNDEISEIMINDFDEIYIEKAGKMEKVSETFASVEELLDVIQRIVGKAGREVNLANPIVDTRLSGGERVNVVLPPVSLGGPIVTIRRFPKMRISMETLISLGSITEEAADFLKELVRLRYNIFISGGTSSGKTTFLNALSDFIPKEERIITIEDSAELQIFGIDNLIRLEARNANTAGTGEITIRDLIKSSLRMRPDRIIVGEVRGAEALDMLNAMNTGHDGSLSTGHANSSYDMIYRLETMILESGVSFPLKAIRQHISSAIDILVHLAKDGAGRRRVVEISELKGLRENEIELSPIFVLKNGELIRTDNELIHTEKMNLYGKDLLR